MFLDELEEAHCVDRTLNNVMRHNPIQREHWKDRETLSPNKWPPLEASLTHERPSFRSTRGAVILRRFVHEHEHVWVWNQICNLVHVCGARHFVAFESMYRDALAREVEAAKRAQECHQRHINTPLSN